MQITYTVKTYGKRLDGKTGITGLISGLCASDVVKQIKIATARNETVVIYDETGKVYSPKDFT